MAVGNGQWAVEHAAVGSGMTRSQSRMSKRRPNNHGGAGRSLIRHSRLRHSLDIDRFDFRNPFHSHDHRRRSARPCPWASSINTACHVLLADALGLVLAEDVASDVDSPPYDKSIVDGYAVVAEDLRDGVARLEILEEVTAGAVPQATVMSEARRRAS